MRHSLKIFFSIFFIVFVMGFCGFGYWLMKEVRSQYSAALEDSMVEFANVLGAYLSTEFEDKKISLNKYKETFEQLRSREFKAKIHGIIKSNETFHSYVTDQKGIILFDSRDPSNIGEDFSQWNDVYLTLKGKYGARSSRENSNDPLSSIYFVAAPILSKGSIVGVVSVIKREQSLSKMINQGRAKIISASIYILLICLIAAFLFSYFLSRPINQLVRYAKEVSEGKSSRPPMTNSPEFKELGSAIDEMRVHLEGKKSIENFIQNLVHELKSPLTSIQAASEILEEDSLPHKKRIEFLSNIQTQTVRAKNVLDELLALASIESQTTLQKNTRFDLKPLLEDLKKDFLSICQRKEVEVQLKLPANSIFVVGDDSLMRKSIECILMNALEFSPGGSIIHVALVQSGTIAQISISDQGPGIPEYAETKIFEKFFSLPRPDTGLKSSGLGLAFAKEVVELHQGSIKLSSQKPLKGTKALISLPI